MKKEQQLAERKADKQAMKAREGDLNQQAQKHDDENEADDNKAGAEQTAEAVKLSKIDRERRRRMKYGQDDADFIKNLA